MIKYDTQYNSIEKIVCMYFVHRFTKFDKKKHLTIEKNSVY